MIATRIKRDNHSEKFCGQGGDRILTLVSSGVAGAVLANHGISSLSGNNIVDVAKSSADHYFSGLRDNDSGLSIFSATAMAGMAFTPTAGLPILTDNNMANPAGMEINPASGMPMIDGAMDISGNAFGMSDSHVDPVSSTGFGDTFASISSGSSWDDGFSSSSLGSSFDSGSSFDYDSGSSYSSGSSWDDHY